MDRFSIINILFSFICVLITSIFVAAVVILNFENKITAPSSFFVTYVDAFIGILRLIEGTTYRWSHFCQLEKS